ncbi:MAG: hypothetical protein V4709_13085, partial [Pseudomonadota bacterium]
LSERSEFRSAPENRASQGSAKHRRIGCVFLWLLSFAQAKESDSPLGETALDASALQAERVSAKERNRDLDSRLRGNDSK